MQVQCQKWPRKQQTYRKVDQKSDWSHSDENKDSQVRSRPIVHDITYDQETDKDQQPSTLTLLRRSNTWLKVLTCGRGRGKFPLANWTSVAKGHGHGLNRRYDIPKAQPVHQEPTVERNIAIVAPKDRVQTYEGNLGPSESRKDLANWSLVRLGNTRARLMNSNNRTEQRQWQRPDDNDDRTLHKTGDHADANKTWYIWMQRDQAYKIWSNFPKQKYEQVVNV